MLPISNLIDSFIILGSIAENVVRTIKQVNGIIFCSILINFVEFDNIKRPADVAAWTIFWSWRNVVTRGRPGRCALAIFLMLWQSLMILSTFCKKNVFFFSNFRASETLLMKYYEFWLLPSDKFSGSQIFLKYFQN